MLFYTALSQGLGERHRLGALFSWVVMESHKWIHT